MTKIGIGVVTYRRLDYLQRVVAAIRKHTRADHELVVADDGGGDGTVEWCRAEGIRVVSGANGGVCWNKNRALFALQSLGCDPVLLVEDDCLPIEDGWEEDWRVSTALFGHLSYAHPKITPWLISGSGTAVDPYVNNKATAQCSSASAVALARVGYFDTRFKGYGVGHAEWTTRMKREGFGFKHAIDAEGRSVKANLYITGGMVGDDAPTFKDRANVARNEALFDALKKEPTYRNPWSTAEEKARFLGEQTAGGIDVDRYLQMQRDAATPFPEMRMRLQPHYHRALRMLFGRKDSFLNASGWLASIAQDPAAVDGEIAPGFNYSLLTLLRDRAQPEWRVFEFRAGVSTVWWSGRAAETVALEPEGGVPAAVERLWVGRSVSVSAPGDDRAEAIRRAEGAFDVVVVNDEDRYRSVHAAFDKLTPSGIILVENDDRKNMTKILSAGEKRGFRELWLTGPAPGEIAPRGVSVLYRRLNGLGL